LQAKKLAVGTWITLEALTAVVATTDTVTNLESSHLVADRNNMTDDLVTRNHARLHTRILA